MFTSGPVNPGRQVDWSTGGQVRNTHNALHSCILTDEQVMNTNNALLFIYISVNSGR